MNASRKLAALIAAAMALVLPPHRPSVADQVKAPVISTGTAATTTGSWMIVGQTAIGTSTGNAHRMQAGAIPVLLALSGRAPRADLDFDGDVDLDDHIIFATCMNGPDIDVPPRGCTQEQFDRADIQGDHDVDLDDFKNLSATFMGG